MTIGREYITIIEIDVDFCNLTFGTSPCTASLSSTVARKCFNTRGTCKDPLNLDLGTLTLRFAMNQSGLPKGQTIFPCLKSVSERAGEINLSGVSNRSSALGKRTSIDVKMQDFAYHDTLTDKYQAERVSGAAQQSGVGYQPIDHGTFFGRLRSRWPHWKGGALRRKRGLVGQPLAEMETEHFVLTDWKGPSASGAVDFTAKDPIELTEDALCPRPSNGAILGDMSISATTATLSPAGIGDEEYEASGRICIGSEVMTFTRSGDALTITGRGVDGTTAAAHSAGDTAQECYHLSKVPIPDAAYELFTDYAGVSSDFISTPEWTTENHWMAGFNLTVTIPRPEPVYRLIEEICQLGVQFWWEPTEQKIKYRPNRPLEVGEVFTPITDAGNIIEGSGETEVSEALRAGAVFLWHGVNDPTKSKTDRSNYQKSTVALSSEGGYQDDAYREILTRWFGPLGNDAAAATISDRLVTRYERAPLTIKFKLDPKDRDSVRLGDLVRVTSRLIQDDAGFGDGHTAQVKFVKSGAGEYEVKVETYDIDKRFGYFMTDEGGTPEYDTATDGERKNGAFFFDENETSFSDGTGPYLFF